MVNQFQATKSNQTHNVNNACNGKTASCSGPKKTANDVSEQKLTRYVRREWGRPLTPRYGIRGNSGKQTGVSPWWICPAGTGRCCVWLGRPRARCDTVKPGSLSRARKSFHLRPGGQEERGQRVKASHKQRLQFQPDLRWIQSQNSAKSVDLSTRATQNKWAKLFSLPGHTWCKWH